MNRPCRHAFWITPLLAVVFATAPMAALETVSPYHKTPMQKEYEALLPTTGAAAQIAGALLATADEAQLDKRIAYLASAAQDIKAHAVIGAICDDLQKRGDLRATIIAADLLLNCINVTKLSSYGSSKEILRAPDPSERSLIPGHSATAVRCRGIRRRPG
jgi:hypothetical protein